MANVMELLRKIKTAIYGRDVRQSIYDAILQCYQDATGNPESIAAHTGDTNNPHNVTAEQVGLGTASEDIANAKNDIEKLKTPEFDDFTEDGSTPPDARTAIAALTSKMSIFTAISKIKAALMGLVTLGEMRDLLINNGLTTEAGKYFLDAAFGKTLADKDTELAALIAKLNSDISSVGNVIGEVLFAGDAYCIYAYIPLWISYKYDIELISINIAGRRIITEGTRFEIWGDHIIISHTSLTSEDVGHSIYISVSYIEK